MSLILAGNVPTISYIVRYNTTEAKSSVKVKAEASNNKHKQQSNVGDRIVVARGDKHRSSNNGQTSEESTGRHEEASNAGQTIQVSILCQWCVSRRIMESWASRQRSEELTMSYLCIAITLCVLFHKKYDVVLDWSLSNHDHFYFPFHGSKIINHTHFIQPNTEDVVECKMDLPKGVGSLACRMCSASYQMPIHHLHEPVDVFSEWLDDCEAAERGEVAAAPSSSSSGRRDLSSVVHDTNRDYDDDDEDDEDDLPEASGLGQKRVAKNNNSKGTQGDEKEDDGGTRKGKNSAVSSLGLDDSEDDDDDSD